MAHKFNITYANGDTAVISSNGTADNLFQELFSHCSDKIKKTCSVVDATEVKPKTPPTSVITPAKQMQPAAVKPAPVVTVKPVEAIKPAVAAPPAQGVKKT
jgi:hypothetical protein